MTRSRMTPERYAALKAFLAAIEEHIDEIKIAPAEIRPHAVLLEMERRSMVNARKGLAMCINDFVEIMSDWGAQKVSQIDEDFRHRGIPTISELRLEYSRDYRRILKRGSITSEADYYLLKGISDDMGLSDPAGAQRKSIDKILSQYEEQVASGRP